MEHVQHQAQHFYDLHYRSLKMYCIALTGSRWDGEDLAQETMLKLLFKKNLMKQSLSSSYVKKTAKHLWIDRLRKNTEIMTENLKEKCSEESSFEQLWAISEVLAATLTLQQTKAFLLKDVFRFQIKEIGELMKMSEVAVKSMLHRARKRLKKKEHLETADAADHDVETVAQIVAYALWTNDPTLVIQLPVHMQQSNDSIFMLSSTNNRTFKRAIEKNTINMLYIPKVDRWQRKDIFVCAG